jgi:hypothetical protein
LFINIKAIEVNNHISNTKFCLSRLLTEKAKDPIYKIVTQAKSMSDLCDALQVEFSAKFSDVVSRGEKSVVAKAAEGIFESKGQARLSLQMFNVA